ncbi:hypothetical protein D3C85_1337210 [compost metagenome]
MIFDHLPHFGPKMCLATEPTRFLNVMTNAVMLIGKAGDKGLETPNTCIKLIEQVASKIDEIQIDSRRHDGMLLVVGPFVVKAGGIERDITQPCFAHPRQASQNPSKNLFFATTLANKSRQINWHSKELL